MSLIQLFISDCWLSELGIVFTGTTRFHVPNYTHLTVFSTNLRLNRHCSRLQSGSISELKILMINFIDKDKKVNINFNSRKKSRLDNRQPSKALKFNRQSYTSTGALKNYCWQLDPLKQAIFEVSRDKNI